MPARKRPTRADTVTARKILLDGLADDAGIFALISEFAPLHPRDNTFPGEVLLEVGVCSARSTRSVSHAVRPVESLWAEGADYGLRPIPAYAGIW